MKQESLSKWLKLVLIGAGICGLVVYGLVIPVIGQEIIYNNPEFSYWFIPWLVFTLATGIPCYIALVSGWQIAKNIGLDMSFSFMNAKHLKRISYLAAIDAAYVFVGNIVLLLLNMNHPGVVLGSMLIVFMGVAISVASAALSHLVMKAAELQEVSEGTI